MNPTEIRVRSIHEQVMHQVDHQVNGRVLNTISDRLWRQVADPVRNRVWALTTGFSSNCELAAWRLIISQMREDE